MYIDKIIKREILTLIVSVVVLIALIIGVSYSLIFSIDEKKQNIVKNEGLEITFCNDINCDSSYDNLNNVIGTKKIDGVSYPEKLYSYDTTYDALESNPYIFNIKNNNKFNLYLTLLLKEDTDYILPDTYLDLQSTIELYKEHLRIGINECNEKINKENTITYKYGELDNGKIPDSILATNDKKNIYCLWTWLDGSTPKNIQNTYFVATLDFIIENKPEK